MKRTWALGIAALSLIGCLADGFLGLEGIAKVLASDPLEGSVSAHNQNGPHLELYLGTKKTTRTLYCSLAFTELSCATINNDPEEMDPEIIFDWGRRS